MEQPNKRSPGRPKHSLSGLYVLGGRAVDVRIFREKASPKQKKLIYSKVKQARLINKTLREALAIPSPEQKVMLLESLILKLKTGNGGQNVSRQLD